MRKIAIASLVISATALLADLTPAAAQQVPVDSLIKGGLTGVYYYAADGNRYVFPNSATYASWFSDYSFVITVSDQTLASIPLKGNVTYRPGVKLVKIQTDPKVYAIGKGGVLRWIENEALAEKLYGKDWNRKIDDVPDVFFTNYKIGDQIKNESDYSPSAVASEVLTINKDKGVTESASAPKSDTDTAQPEPPSGTIPATPATPATPANPVAPNSGTSTPTVPATPATPAVPPESATTTPPTPPPTPATQGTVIDDFNGYVDGSIIGQGNWQNYANGNNFVVQELVTFDGGKALYVSATADSIIAKAGNVLSSGKQAFRVRTINRSAWGAYADGNAQVRVSKGSWGSPFAAVSFKSDGNVAYYDTVADAYRDFSTYNDDEWVLLEIEWRSSDRTARYRVNGGTWTDWHSIAGSGSFTVFDHVGMDFYRPSGSGGVYFDTLY